jgi:hypothetical protein
MCARNDTVVIPLDSTIGQKNPYYNPVEWLWWKTFEYGIVYGSAACLSKKEIMMYSDWNGVGNNVPYVLNTSSDELVGLSGYYMNADINPDIPDSEKPDYARKYCVWKLTHPMSSSWTRYSYISSTSIDCINNCLGNFIRFGSLSFDLVKSIGTVPPWNE